MVVHKIHQCILKLMRKSISRNRLFAECQSISPKMFIHYEGKNKTSQCRNLADATLTKWLRLAPPTVRLQPSTNPLIGCTEKGIASFLWVSYQRYITSKRQTHVEGMVCKIPDQYSSKVVIKVIEDKEGQKNCHGPENSKK